MVCYDIPIFFLPLTVQTVPYRSSVVRSNKKEVRDRCLHGFGPPPVINMSYSASSKELSSIVIHVLPNDPPLGKNIYILIKQRQKLSAKVPAPVLCSLQKFRGYKAWRILLGGHTQVSTKPKPTFPETFQCSSIIPSLLQHFTASSNC